MSDPDPVDTRARLQAAALRVTATSPARIGYWLARYLEAEKIDPAELAARLGVDLAGLARLALCATPNPARFAADLATIVTAVGANPVILANWLQQEQTLAIWAEPSGAVTSESASCWLLAAHDADQPPPGDGDDEPGTN